MKINATEIRVGMILEYKNDLWEILKTNHVKPGKGGAFAQVEMKSLLKNTKLNERFRSNETVEKASIEDLIKALDNKTVHSAALDVFEEEPLPLDSKLIKHDFCILGSHNASNTKEAVLRTSKKVIKLLSEFLRN